MSGALTFAVGVAASANVRLACVSGREYLKNTDLIPKVAKELGAQLCVYENEAIDDNMARLKPNLNNKVCVYISENMPERTKENIKKSVNYYNDILKDMTSRYKLELCDKARYLADLSLQKATVRFAYKTIDDEAFSRTLGATFRRLNKSPLYKLINNDWYVNNVYNVNNVISLNKNYIDNFSDETQEYIIRHEILHIFGFEDTYSGYFEEASLLNPDYIGVTNKLGPEDMNRLYAVYCDKFYNEDNTINETKLAEVKAYLKDYKKEYYRDMINKIKDIKGETFYNFTEEDLNDLKLKYNTNVFTLIDDHTYERGEMGGREIRRRYKGEYLKYDDALVFMDIRGSFTRDYYVVLKNDQGLNVYDLCNSFSSTINNDGVGEVITTIVR